MGNPDSAGSAPAKPAEKTDTQASHIVRFDPADGSKPTQSTVKTGTLAAPPQQNPVRDGFLFDGWTYDGQPFDFQTPILKSTTLKAQWTNVTDWTLSPDHGPASGARVTISSPGRQEPRFSNIQAAGEQTVGLTGDGRIYTWTQDNTPKQVPLPDQSPDGFRYLQAAAGSQWQAALGSDQHIYTWTRQQTEPITLNTSTNTQFTSISMNDERLLAVDRQGRVHALQTGQTSSQNLNPKLTEPATTRLPGQAQAVLAVASTSCTLIVDADRQAWTWDTSNTGRAEPERIKQDPGIHISQARALSQGFLLLDADGRVYHLADNMTSLTAVNLPEGMKASRITANKDQAIIVGKDGQVWAWKPGEAPKRADNENQLYVQAASTDSRIIALSTKGDMFTWSLDKQGQPGKPARLDTAQAPTLESASIDGQALALSRNNDSWQADMPTHQPGPAAITITGRQDGQPFTRSLMYTVDQTLTRGAEPRSTLTVRFDTDGGNPEPADQQFSTPNSRVRRPSPDPARQGFLFDGWFIGQAAYDFSKPVDKDLTLTAHWSPAGRNSTWSISPDKGSQLGKESTTITPPDSASRGIRFNQVSGSENQGDSPYNFSLAVDSDGNAYAWGNNQYGQLGDGTTSYRTTPVMVGNPDRETYPDLPQDFTYVQVSAGQYHSLALGSDGNTYAWGRNDYGQLGDGTTTERHTPVRINKPEGTPADFTYVQVSAGWYHSLALGSDGNAYAWGYNGNGQLGNGTGTQRNTPVRVKTPDRNTYPDLPTDFTYLQVSAGCTHSLAVGSDGYAYAWGNNSDGQLGKNTTRNSSLPVRVRDPANPTDKSKGLKAVQVSAGFHHSLAMGTDGNAYAWGANGYGQLGDGSTDSKSAPVPVSFNLQLVITGVRFDSNAGTNLTRGDSNSVTVLTPAHQPGTVTVSVDYTLGGAPQNPDTSLRYTYLPAGVLPKAGGEGILLALATGMTGMGGVLASRRHRREQHQLSHASHE
ncbi:InlB B-repeat-containing protein [Bifidobacterium sp. W8112]|uniref:InlB B-repeat-containing protein n=1 Tax=Bifidobacterium sp. W8112 TaxID=2750974 RepID=UPI001E56BF75|nr:InlB B-repeat-containing protein [Bifidobacterium sp. W8112]